MRLQARLDQAVEIVRQCGAAAVAPPEASVLALLQALIAAERPQHALGVHDLLGGGASVAVLAALLQGLLHSKEASKLAVRDPACRRLQPCAPPVGDPLH